jgi:hypothetical protein
VCDVYDDGPGGKRDGLDGVVSAEGEEFREVWVESGDSGRWQKVKQSGMNEGRLDQYQQVDSLTSNILHTTAAQKNTVKRSFNNLH